MDKYKHRHRLRCAGSVDSICAADLSANNLLFPQKSAETPEGKKQSGGGTRGGFN